MQLTLLTTTALATPVPANNVNDSLQIEILAKEITIINITNSIVQYSPSLKAHYDAGIKHFIPLISGLEGPQPCSIFTPGRPDTRDAAASSLQESDAALMQLSLELLDPSRRVGDVDFHASVCQAWGWCNAVGGFVGA
ncbi:hypothetical protein MBLNU13_g04536t1 [Cladosporium sp. NU13]